jgi:hypothetical protein
MDIYPPVLIYLCLSILQIILDLVNGLYNTSLMKLIVVVTVAFLLQALCINDMCIISWIIVFVPFIFMSIVISILLYIFGLNIAYGIANNTQAIITSTNTNTYSANSNIAAPSLYYSSDPEFR